STRLIGGMVMTHSDDDGLIVPPMLAPKHVVILPIIQKDADRGPVMEYCHRVAAELREQSYGDGKVQVEIDARDLRGGAKVWQQIKRGVPVRLEIGPRDMQNDAVFVGRRDKPSNEKAGQPRAQFVAGIGDLLREIQHELFARALRYREEATRKIDDLAEFK